MVGLGFIFISAVFGGAVPGASFIWHLAVSGFLSFVLETDTHKAVGVDPKHLIIGAAAHLALGAILAFSLLTGSSSSSQAASSGKKKK